MPALAALPDGGAAILLKVDDSGESGGSLPGHAGEAERPQMWSEAEVARRFGETAQLLLMTSSRARSPVKARGSTFRGSSRRWSNIASRCATCWSAASFSSWSGLPRRSSSSW
jgi:hypothetical protein